MNNLGENGVPQFAIHQIVAFFVKNKTTIKLTVCHILLSLVCLLYCLLYVLVVRLFGEIGGATLEGAGSKY